ncbi:DUF58 domain-containing protein [Chloroflexota bacterium]
MTSTYILSLSVAIVCLYLTWQGLYALRILSNPLAWQKTAEIQVVAGEIKQIPIKFANKTGRPLSLRIEATDKWVRIDNSEFDIDESGQFEVTFEPSLAGPQVPQLKVSVADSLGLLQAGYLVDCARLTVIPRARYSAYLARKYLEGGAGTSISNSALTSSSLSSRKGTGIEYHSSHMYSPGDRITDIDWKHTARYRELVVKKYQNDYGNSAIILANATATSADEADIVSSSLINSVLALAMNSMHGALVVYDEHKVMQQTSMMPSTSLLKNVLDMIESISFIESSTRYLSLPDITALNRTRRNLANVDLEPAKKLLEILDIEINAIRMSTSHHPLSLAINKVTSYVPPPATIVPITALNHDSEALSYLLPNLKARGYRILATGTNNKASNKIGLTLS